MQIIINKNNVPRETFTKVEPLQSRLNVKKYFGI